jgi:RNA polymerase sigma-70 factor (ECF subfamily)
MIEANTTSVVQQYLDELAGDAPPEPIIRALLDKSARRLYLLCSTWLSELSASGAPSREFARG